VLRDAALAILRAKGEFKITDAGVCLYVFDGDEIRIGYQPAIAGASMPSFIDISETVAVDTVKVFTVYWFQDGRFEVIRHKSGPWEDTLRQRAGEERLRSPLRGQQSCHKTWGLSHLRGSETD
jgi:hypothetical protein